MLVLTRKTEEKIVIGKNNQIVITILKIQGDKVSIGIEADKETPIYRFELLLKDLERNAQKNFADQETAMARDVAKKVQVEINKTNILEGEIANISRD